MICLEAVTALGINGIDSESGSETGQKVDVRDGEEMTAPSF